MMRAEISEVNGRLSIFVNGERIITDSYITYFTHNARYSEFSGVGYKLYSLPVFFSSKTLNENAQYPCFGEAIFDTGEPKWEILDKNIEKILAACPDALIFPRVNLSPSEAWERAHPDELCDFGMTELARPCFSSRALAEEMKRMLGLMIDHVKTAHYREHVIGYQLASGTTEEWMPFDFKGSIGLRSREAFPLYAAREGIAQTEEEYYGFLSAVTAGLIRELAAFTKERTDGELLVGTFYGYTLECPDRKLCHAALREVIDSPDVDFLCSPVSYAKGRELGRDHGYMLPVDSLKKRGKLFMSENDTRTHLTRSPYPDNPYFDAPIFRPIPEDAAAEMLKMHYARSMVRGVGHWWFDMWGGWYDGYAPLMQKFLNISREAAELPSGSVSEIAVFVDERAYKYIRDASVGYSVVYDSREALGKIGAPYDIYLADDYDEVKSKYKLAVILEPCATELSRYIERDAQARGMGLIKLNEESIEEMTSGRIREACRNSGVHLYFDEDVIVYVNESYLFAHFTRDGLHRLNMPYPCRLYDVMDEAYADCEISAKEKCGKLYRLEKDNA